MTQEEKIKLMLYIAEMDYFTTKIIHHKNGSYTIYNNQEFYNTNGHKHFTKEELLEEFALMPQKEVDYWKKEYDLTYN